MTLTTYVKVKVFEAFPHRNIGRENGPAFFEFCIFLNCVTFVPVCGQKK